MIIQIYIFLYKYLGALDLCSHDEVQGSDVLWRVWSINQGQTFLPEIQSIRTCKECSSSVVPTHHSWLRQNKVKLLCVKVEKPFIFSHNDFRWWSDIRMIRGLLDCARYEGSPLAKLSASMDWGISFSQNDLAELQKYLELVGPLEKMFQSLNSDKESNIQRVVPSILVRKIFNKVIVCKDTLCREC